MFTYPESPVDVWSPGGQEYDMSHMPLPIERQRKTCNSVSRVQELPAPILKVYMAIEWWELQ